MPRRAASRHLEGEYGGADATIPPPYLLAESKTCTHRHTQWGQYATLLILQKKVDWNQYHRYELYTFFEVHIGQSSARAFLHHHRWACPFISIALDLIIFHIPSITVCWLLLIYKKIEDDGNLLPILPISKKCKLCCTIQGFQTGQLFANRSSILRISCMTNLQLVAHLKIFKTWPQFLASSDLGFLFSTDMKDCKLPLLLCWNQVILAEWSKEPTVR